MQIARIARNPFVRLDDFHLNFVILYTAQ